MQEVLLNIGFTVSEAHHILISLQYQLVRVFEITTNS